MVERNAPTGRVRKTPAKAQPPSGGPRVSAAKLTTLQLFRLNRPTVRRPTKRTTLLGRVLDDPRIRLLLVVVELLAIGTAIWALLETLSQTRIAADAAADQRRSSAYGLLTNEAASGVAIWQAARQVVEIDGEVSSAKVPCTEDLNEFYDMYKRHPEWDVMDFPRNRCGILFDYKLGSPDDKLGVTVRNSSANLMTFADPVFHKVSFDGVSFTGTWFSQGTFDFVHFDDSNLDDAFLQFGGKEPFIRIWRSSVQRAIVNTNLTNVWFTRSNISGIRLCDFGCAEIDPYKTFNHAYFMHERPPHGMDQYPGGTFFGYECWPRMLPEVKADGPAGTCNPYFTPQPPK